MKEKATATIWTCDGCKERYVQLKGEDLPLGYYGTFMHHYGSGGDGAEFYACSEPCLRDAITNAENYERNL